MAGFRKAKAEQAAIKMGLYGLAGSGKTFTALLLAEGLAKASGKRIAFVDTEHGTDFYCQKTPRPVHPEAFDFDAIYTKSITQVLAEVDHLDAAKHGVLVIDSISHIWDSCMASYEGRQTSVGSIPFHAWNKIKAPYKRLMSLLIDAPFHVIICGRQANEFDKDPETEQLSKVGVKMRAQGETPHEPHILVRMQSVRPDDPKALATILAYVEKDRTGVLNGRTIQNPNFESLAKPIMPLLGGTQAKMATEEETARQDAETLARDEAMKAEASAFTLKEISARITLAANMDALKEIGKSITPKVKAGMVAQDVASLRKAYQTRELELASGRVMPTTTADAPREPGADDGGGSHGA